MSFDGDGSTCFRIPHYDVRIRADRNNTFPGVQVKNFGCCRACHRHETRCVHFAVVLKWCEKKKINF